MTLQSIEPSSKTGTRPSRSLVLWGVFCIALAFYSLLVWDAGIKLLPQNYDPTHDLLIDRVEAQGNLGVPYAQVAEDAFEAYPLWNNLTAMVTGTYFGFGSNDNSDPVRYYTSMGPVEKSVFSLHMVLGRALLILGMFVMTFAAIYHMVHVQPLIAAGRLDHVVCANYAAELPQTPAVDLPDVITPTAVPLGPQSGRKPDRAAQDHHVEHGPNRRH